MRPGDALFIPPLFPHLVRNFEGGSIAYGVNIISQASSKMMEQVRHLSPYDRAVFACHYLPADYPDDEWAANYSEETTEKALSDCLQRVASAKPGLAETLREGSYTEGARGHRRDARTSHARSARAALRGDAHRRRHVAGRHGQGRRGRRARSAGSPSRRRRACRRTTRSAALLMMIRRPRPTTRRRSGRDRGRAVADGASRPRGRARRRRRARARALRRGSAAPRGHLPRRPRARARAHPKSAAAGGRGRGRAARAARARRSAARTATTRRSPHRRGARRLDNAHARARAAAAAGRGPRSPRRATAAARAARRLRRTTTARRRRAAASGSKPLRHGAAQTSGPRAAGAAPPRPRAGRGEDAVALATADEAPTLSRGAGGAAREARRVSWICVIREQRPALRATLL